LQARLLQARLQTDLQACLQTDLQARLLQARLQTRLPESSLHPHQLPLH
jgi:hypothetical protein